MNHTTVKLDALVNELEENKMLASDSTSALAQVWMAAVQEAGTAKNKQQLTEAVLECASQRLDFRVRELNELLGIDLPREKMLRLIHLLKG